VKRRPLYVVQRTEGFVHPGAGGAIESLNAGIAGDEI
jgi:hypothetical protein